MKKTVLALLAVLLLFTGCVSNYAVVKDSQIEEAVAAGINLLDNPGLETGDGQNWGFSDLVFVSSAQAHEGDYSIEFIPGGGNEYFFNVMTADADKDGAYLISAWIKLTSAFDADRVWFELERQNKGGRNDMFRVRPAKTSDWQQVKIEVPATAKGSVDYIVVKAEVNTASAPVFFDDFSVVSTSPESVNYIRNGHFSDRGSEWANYRPSYGLDGKGAALTFNLENSGLVQSSLWWGQKRPVFNPELDMEFSAMVSPAASSSGVVRLSVERKPDLGVIYMDYTIKPGSGWQKITLPVAGVSSDCYEAIYHIDALDGEGKVFVDDVTLTVSAALSDGKSAAVKSVSSSDIALPLLTNGNLESGDNGISSNWGLAPGWDRVPLSKWSADGDAKSGSGAVHVKQYGFEQVFLQADGWQDRSTTGVYDPEKPMVFSAYLKSENLTGDGAYLRVERKYDEGGSEKVLLSTSAPLKGTSDGWVKLETYVEPSSIKFKECLWDVVIAPGEGAVSIDDLAFNEAEDAAAAEALNVVPEVSGNVLRNPGLELLNQDGSVLHWDVWPGKPEEGVRNYEIDHETMAEGENALRVNLEMGNPQAVYQYCVEGTMGKFDFDKVYTFTLKMKADSLMTFDGKGVSIGIKRRGEDGNEYNVFKRVDDVGEDWADYSVTAEEAPCKIVQYDVIVDIGAGIGSLWMDDCRLELSDGTSALEESEIMWE